MPFVTPLPGVPSIESPFFERLFADADPETKRIAQSLHDDGYALIDFPEPDFDAMAEMIIATLGPRMAAAGNRIQDGWRDVPVVHQIACNTPVLDLLSRLYGRRAFPFQTLNFPVGTQQPAHSDSVHFSSIPERFMCGVWVALEDIHQDAGPLMWYPGSHRLPIYTNEHIGYAAHAETAKTTQAPYHQAWQALVEAHQLKPKSFLPKRGQAVIWAANLLHGGSAQTDLNRTRWSQVTHYYFEDCAFYTPMHSDPAYGKVAFRRIENIATGQVVPNRYQGLEIPRDFISITRPGTPSIPRRALNFVRRLVS